MRRRVQVGDVYERIDVYGYTIRYYIITNLANGWFEAVAAYPDTGGIYIRQFSDGFFANSTQVVSNP